VRITKIYNKKVNRYNRNFLLNPARPMRPELTRIKAPGIGTVVGVARRPWMLREES